MSATPPLPGSPFAYQTAEVRARSITNQARLIARLEARAAKLRKQLTFLDEQLSRERKVMRVFVQDAVTPPDVAPAPPIEAQP